MEKIEIKSRWNGAILFSGEFASLKEAVQEAVKNKANLEGANLEGANLEGANLRGADLGGANLEGAYLRGANLEGAYLRGANLRGANLRGADLGGAYLRGANLRGANLRGADLGGAYLGGANLRGANLEGAEIRKDITVTQSPIQIIGLTWFVTVWDAHMQIGCEFHSHEEWRGFDDEKWLQMGGKDALRLKQEHLVTLIALCESHAKKAIRREDAKPD